MGPCPERRRLADGCQTALQDDMQAIDGRLDATESYRILVEQAEKLKLHCEQHGCAIVPRKGMNLAAD